MKKTSNSNKKSPHKGHRERLRNRYESYGFNSLQDYEKVELLLTCSVSRKDVKQPAKELIDKFGTISALMDAELDEIKATDGIGEVSAFLVKIIKDFCTEYLYGKNKSSEENVFNSPQSVYEFCRLKIGADLVESFMIILVNTKNIFLDYKVITEGTVDNVQVFPREIVEQVIKHPKKASGVILVHNHPSGQAEPSEQDKKITNKLIKIADPLGIRILDHIIVSKGGFFSFLDNGLL